MAELPWPVGPITWSGGATVWLVPLGPGAAWHVDRAAILSPEEQMRASRFRRDVDRDRFIASHAALRIILAGALGTSPEAVSLSVCASGKPQLDGTLAGLLQFNLSHSGHLALVGLAEVPIGVDIEAMRPLPDALTIARTHFHPAEIACIAAQPPQRRRDAFYGGWTRKEAFVKALGSGLAMRLDGFCVSIPPAPPALLCCDASAGLPADWTLHHLEPEHGTIGAVAIAAREAPCARYRLAPDWFAQLRPA